MKFAKSERNLHQLNQFNPPCNIYSPDTIINSNLNQIVTGSLKGPSFIQKSTFGFSQRFNNKHSNENDISPGPGSYQSPCIIGKIQNNQSVKPKITKVTKIKSNEVQTSPSIPYNFYGKKKDADDEMYITKLRLAEDISKSNKITMKNATAFSFSKSQKSSSFLPQNPKIQTRGGTILEQQQIIQQVDRKQHLKQNNTIWRQKIQKSTQKRKEIITMITPQYTPSLELIELISKRRSKVLPGPGSYEPKVSLQNNKCFYTFSQLKRFPVSHEAILGPGSYPIPQNISGKRSFSFNRSEKPLFQQINHKENTNYRFYIDINTENPVKQKKTQEFSSAFGSGVARFTLKKQIDQNQEKSLQKNKSSNFIKKLKIRQKNNTDDKQDGLLAISTMVSTID